ncbi:MAG: alpha/beta hydrolase [Burkholderiaceae bacterium]
MTSSALINSTTVRLYPAGLTMLRGYFRVLSRVSPGLAGRQAERVFTVPPRYHGAPLEGIDAREERVRSGRHSLAVWQVGALSAPKVLLVHGWGGRGEQLSSFLGPLVEAGYGVVWFDQPGHGASGRGPSSLADFVRAVQTLERTHGPFAAAIGHSLGAAALALALRAGLALPRVAFVGPPASITEYAHRFARLMGITPAIREAMQARLERRFGMRFAYIDSIDDLRRLDLPALFVHDKGDRQIPFDDTRRLVARMPKARLVTTYGLGHHRILREPSVVATVVRFVRGETDLPVELPALPRPSPIY